MAIQLHKTLLASVILSSMLGQAYAKDGADSQAENKAVTQLETIVVTASGFEQNIKQAPASISCAASPLENQYPATEPTQVQSLEWRGCA